MKQKILIVDVEFIKGHKMINKKIVSWLEESFDLFFIDNKYQIFDYADGNKILTSDYSQQSNLIKRIKGFFKTASLILDIVREKEIDKVILLSYEYRSFSLYAKKISDLSEVFVFHHNDLDRDIGKKSFNLKKKLYNKTFRFCQHIVFHDFIKKKLQDYLGDVQEIVHVINHPITREIIPTKSADFSIQQVVGLSETNDDYWINMLIEDEKKNETFKNIKVSAVIKNKNITFKDPSVEIFDEYLTDEDYEFLISNSDAFLRFFSSDFHARTSGTIIDSLSMGVPFVGTGIPAVKEFEKRYPSIVRSFDTYEDFINVLVNWKLYKEDKIRDFEKFLNDFSDEKLRTEFLNIIREEK